MRAFDYKDKLYLSAIRVNILLTLCALILFSGIRFFTVKDFSLPELAINLRFDFILMGIILLNAGLFTFFTSFLGATLSFILFEVFTTIYWSLVLFIGILFGLGSVNLINNVKWTTVDVYRFIEKDGVFWFIDQLKAFWGGEIYFALILIIVFLAFFSWIIMLKVSVFNGPPRKKRFVRPFLLGYWLFTLWLILGGNLNGRQYSPEDISIKASTLKRLYSGNYIAYKGLTYHSPESFPVADRSQVSQGLKKLFDLDYQTQDLKTLLSRQPAGLISRNLNIVVFVLDGFNGYWRKFDSKEFSLIPQGLKDEPYLANFHSASDTKDGNLSSLLLGIPTPSYKWDFWSTTNLDHSFYQLSIARFFQKANFSTYYLAERNLLEYDRSTKLGKMGFERVVHFKEGYYKTLKFLRKRLDSEVNSFWLVEGCKKLDNTEAAEELVIPKDLEKRLGSYHDESYFKHYRSCLELTYSTIRKLKSENTLFVVMGAQVDHGNYLYQEDELEDRLKLGAWVISPTDLELGIDRTVYASVIDIMPTLSDLMMTTQTYFSLGRSLFDVKKGHSYHPDFQLGKNASENYNYLLHISSALKEK
jgi:hypothetical protein